jgi:hypothetical protein
VNTTVLHFSHFASFFFFHACEIWWLMEPSTRSFLRSLELATFAHAKSDLSLCTASLRSLLKDAGISSRSASALRFDGLTQPLRADTAVPEACNMLGIHVPENVWLGICARLRERIDPISAPDDSQSSQLSSPSSQASERWAILPSEVSELQEFTATVHCMSKRQLLRYHRSSSSAPNPIDHYVSCQLQEHVSSALVKDRLIDLLVNDLRAAKQHSHSANRRASTASVLVSRMQQNISSHPNMQLQLSWKGKGVGNALVSHDSDRKRWHLTESAKLAAAVRRTVANIPAYLFGAAAMADISPGVVHESEILLNACLLAAHREFHAVLGLAVKSLAHGFICLKP